MKTKAGEDRAFTITYDKKEIPNDAIKLLRKILKFYPIL